MKTFLKTFFICLFLTLGLIAYNMFNSDSYDKDLKVSKNNPFFGNNYDDKYTPADENNKNHDMQKPSETPELPSEPVQEEKLYTQICYFYSDSGQLVPIERKIKKIPSLETTINSLLKGPTISESKKGIHTEIPANVDLISLKTTNDSVIVNLSSNFGNGGGSESIENRLKQLSKTVKKVSSKKVYLYINNEEVEYLGGDGVYVKQPLE